MNITEKLTSQSDTPRTNYESNRLDHYFNCKQMVYADFSRQLERELNDARASEMRMFERSDDVLQRLNEAKEIIEKLLDDANDIPTRTAAFKLINP